MAIQSFYISVEISEEDKANVLSKLPKDDIKSDKISPGDFTYKNTLYIDNITIVGSWWHINAGLYDFFHSCEILYEFCQNIDTIKPNFTFDFLGKQYEFKFPSLMDFISFIYPKIEIYKKNLEKTHGVLSIPPNKFFNFKRKNQKFFR